MLTCICIFVFLIFAPPRERLFFYANRQQTHISSTQAAEAALEVAIASSINILLLVVVLVLSLLLLVVVVVVVVLVLVVLLFCTGLPGAPGAGRIHSNTCWTNIFQYVYTYIYIYIYSNTRICILPFIYNPHVPNAWVFILAIIYPPLK